jgi:hypothetical protein
MSNDLSPAEREDREADRLLNRKPAPSRKHKERRAPRHEQRRRRVREKDPDTTKRRESSVSDADLDRYLRDLEHMTKEDEADEDFDFDSAIDALSDASDVPPATLEKLVKEHDDSSLLELLKNTGYDMDPARLEEMDRALGLAAFNRAFSPMSPRTGAYHGVRDVRGNPTDSPNTVALPDRRYFTNKDYDAIVKFAGKLLDEDWLKYGWDDGAKDAPLRAALDLSIQTANGNAYQSKIDSETYDLLLNRLAKWGYDTFSDTVLPMKAPKGDNRSASAMIKKNASYQQLVQVASDLRDTNPSAALQIVKNLRSLVSTEAEAVQSISDAASVGSPRAGVASAPAVTAAAEDLAEVPLPVLLKVAAASPAAKAALGPFILAAAKKKDKKKGKGKIPPQFLKNMKKKGDKKASIAAEDASW